MAGIGSYDKKSPGNRGYKMKGSPMQRNYGIGSPAKQKTDTSKQVPLSPHEKKKGTIITGGSDAEVINDLEDRIEFLRSDLQGGGKDKVSIMKLGKQLTKLEARLRKERAK